MNGLLPYTPDAYKNHYNLSFITDFAHKPFAAGVTNLEEAKELIVQLNSVNKTKSISFDANMLTNNQLTGGACSAIALRVAREVFNLTEQLEKENLTKSDRKCALFNKIRQIIEEVNQEGKSSKTSGKAMHTRTIQQAFNTICVDRNKAVEDVFQDKIKAIASFYNLTVSKSSEEAVVNEECNMQELLERQIGSLDAGIHLLRIIDYKYNHKLENCGHSALYIKLGKVNLYFDPALGLYHLVDRVELVYNALKSAQQRFKVDRFRFHKLEVIA